MTVFDEDAFLDQLYEAPANPDLWIPVMERLREMMGGAGCWLSAISAVDGPSPRYEHRFPLRREIFCENRSRHRDPEIAQHVRPRLAGAIEQHDAIG